jgi:hypothetical protein
MHQVEKIEAKRMSAIRLWQSQYCMWKMLLFRLSKKGIKFSY